MTDQDFYNSLFNYIDGVLYYKDTKKRAGGIAKNKYVIIKNKKMRQRQYAHRIIYTMFYGDIPEKHDIHHIDGNRSNNKIENLKAVNRLIHNLERNKDVKIKKEKNIFYINKCYNYKIYVFKHIIKDVLIKIYDNFIQDITNNCCLVKYDKYVSKEYQKRVPKNTDKEYLNNKYDYIDGKLYKKTTGNPIGHFHLSGYYRASINGKQSGLHRWIYIYHYGDIPDNMVIDHIDNDTTNNRIENLRIASYHENSVNRVSKYLPSRCYKNCGWSVRVQRKNRVFYKYFNPSEYEEAVRFCEELDRIRDDINKIEKLFNLNR